jgi:HD-like signal output (HDOD) protein
LAERVEKYGLIVRQAGRPQQVMASFLRMVLSYQYGVDVKIVPDIVDASSALMEKDHHIICVFIIQSQEIPSRTTIPALGQQGQIPLFLLFPKRLADTHNEKYGGTRNVFILAWEGAFNQSETSLKRVIEGAFEQNRIEPLLGDMEDIPYAVLQQKVEQQINNLDTLPTLPEIVMQILKMVNDPETTIQDMEEVLSSDPAIVWKLLDVMKSPVFAAGRRKAEWTLRDVIVRLGVKKVGAIAQQIKLMNSFVKPEDSSFDLRRYWEHSVASAMITENLYTQGKVALEDKLEFNEYWIGALLHDIGKLVLGFAFPQQFEDVLEQMNPKESFGRDFREAEAQLGQAGLHEDIGRLILLKVDAGPKMVEAVGAHHTGGKSSGGLAGLIHISNNLCKDLGLGYHPEEVGVYSESVLEKLNLTEEDIEGLKEEMAESIKDEVKELVSRCIPAERRKNQRRHRRGEVESEEEPVFPATKDRRANFSEEIPDKRDQLVGMLDSIRDQLELDTSTGDEEKKDLLVDVDGVRAQLKKKTPNKNAVLILLMPLAECGAASEAVAEMMQSAKETL